MPIWLGLRQVAFTCVRWQVTLRDPIQQVTLRISEMAYNKSYNTTFNLLTLSEVVMWLVWWCNVDGGALSSASVRRMTRTAGGRDTAGSLWTPCRRGTVGGQTASNHSPTQRRRRQATGAVHWPRGFQWPRRGRARIGSSSRGPAVRWTPRQRWRRSSGESGRRTLDVWTSAGDQCLRHSSLCRHRHLSVTRLLTDHPPSRLFCLAVTLHRDEAYLYLKAASNFRSRKESDFPEWLHAIHAIDAVIPNVTINAWIPYDTVIRRTWA